MKSNRSGVLWRLPAILLALALAATACGGDDDDLVEDVVPANDSTAPDAPEDSAGEEPDESNDTTPAEDESDPAAEEPTAELDPVRVVMILDESEVANLRQDGARAGAEGRVARIDAEGGLGGSGHPLELEICVTDLDPNVALECARNAAADTAVIAIVGSVTSAADLAPVLEEAGLPNVGQLALNAGDFASPLSYPLVGGLAAGVPGQATIASQVLGLERIKNGRVGLETAAQGTILIDLALSSWGAAPTAGAVDVPIGQADVSAQVAAMAEDADAVVLTVLPEQASQIMLARQQLGLEIPFLASSSNFSNEAIEALGAAGEGMQLHAYFPSDEVDTPGNAAYLADIESVDGLDVSGDVSRLAWTAFDFLDYVARNLDSFDRASLVAALDASSGYDAGGLLPPIDFTSDGPNPLFPAIVNLTMVHAEIRDGRIVTVSGTEFLPVYGG